MKHPRPGFPRFVLVACLLPFALAACKREAEAPAPAPAPAMQDAPATPTVGAAKADPEPAAVEQPRLKVTTLDGAAYDLADHRGKWVVVNYWATWCGPCLEEMPELSALDAMHEHIEVIGLAYEDIEVETMRAFLVQHPVVYPIAIVDTFAPPPDFDTPRGLPMTYLIGPDGRVAEKVVGPVTAREIEDAIARHGGPDADTSAPASS